MMRPAVLIRAAWPLLVLLLVAGGVRPASAQNDGDPVAPEPASGPKVQELVQLMATREITTFAVADPEGERRFAAVLLVPNVQLMLVSARYERPTDIAYWIHNQEFMNAYMELNSGVQASEKFFVHDTLVDGLKLLPDEDVPGDEVTIVEAKRVFDGEFRDRPRRDEEVSTADYYQAFAEADRRYTRLLDLLIGALKSARPE